MANQHPHRLKRRRQVRPCNHPRISHDHRRGSALMIVMVLMGMLSLLGVLFYTFSAQERSNAEYYSEAAKDLADPSLDADTLFDWGLEQIIVGTDRRLTNSVLWGSRYSLLSNALGYGLHRPGDLQPFNGEGLNLIIDASGNVAVDQNRNGLPDDGSGGESDYRYLLDIVDTEAAPKTYDSGERQLVTGNLYFPQSDVGYTYPDVNNLFLTHVAKVRDQNGVVHQVVKPAYLAPGLLRAPIGGVSAPLVFEDANYNGVLDAGEDINGNGYLDDWCINPAYAGRIMRAHPSHLFVPAGGLNGTSTRRYLTDAEATTLIGPTARGFPFHPMDPTYDTATTGGAGAAYTAGRMGPYSGIGATNNTDDPIQFDYDNDGDNFREAILMDLDFPVQQDSLGNLFVPMFLITIHDQDGLINLNAHGNLAKLLYGPNDMALANTPLSSATNPFGTDYNGQFNFISQSNLGLSPSEVNPLWALNARIGVDNGATSTVFNQHAQFFGAYPNATPAMNPPWGETANMELAWAKIGRMGYSPSGTGAASDVIDLFPGVYGEEGNLYSALQGGTLSGAGGQSLPRPGVPLQDDNQDVDEGQGSIPFFQHPLDYKGEGSYLNPGNPKQINWSTAVGPNRWIKYTKYGDNASVSTGGNIRWGQNALGLMDSPITQGLGDDTNEIAYYADRQDIDNLFQPDEMLYLNLNNSEIDRLNVTSRLTKLLPFNFARTVNDNARADSIRRKFTVQSHDRKSFGLPVSVRAMGPLGTGQEYSLDTVTGTHKFPPQFGTTARYSYATLAEDPFRYATRSLLEVERVDQVGQQLSNRYQRKLSINHLLTGDANSQIENRRLTPHPDDPGSAVISSVSNVTNYPPTTAAGQEYWARIDRQRLARDIYVMLYLMGHGDDTKNTALTSNANPSLTTDGSTLYSEPQLREMAQFAVNLVDSMDRDSVITRFEYDKDLSDGWNLDDNPYGTLEATPYLSSSTQYNADYPNDSATRGEVFGVERLDMSLSESLFIQAKKSQTATAQNYNQTNFDESTNDRFFIYVELRNHSPFPITINSAKECWQIVLRQEASGAMNPAWERRLTLKDNTLTINNTSDPYVIGSTDATTSSSAFSRSTFAVDPAWAGAPTARVAPNKPATATVLDCDLDLIETTNPSTVFKIENESGTDITATAGAMLSAFTGTTPIANTGANATLKVQLRRRAHPTRTTADPTDNPWVEVDSMVLSRTDGYGYTVFDMGAMPSATIAAQQLKKVVGRERPQPLDGGLSEAASTGTTVATTLNTLGQKNSNSPSVFNLWQIHFDRDYASVMDLLYLPLFGPHQLTALTRSAFMESPLNQVKNPVLNAGWTTGGSPGTPYSIAAKSAASRFMVPEDPANITSTAPNRYLDNRWHRILELVEVPTRTNVNLGVGTDLSISRVPGRINLNTVRHADVLAALLDDGKLMSLNLTSSSTADPDAPSIDDIYDGTNRDWWRQFLLSRDLPDPYGVNNGVSLPLPGLPGSKPFRSLADVGYQNPSSGGKHASIEDTILRGLPVDSTTVPRTDSTRRLFEVGTLLEHQGSSATPIDPYIRNRLLSKIAGNTTTRSNCFGIFISVKYFQAVEQNGAIRIGGPLNGKPTPEHRGFFVVDRSKLENGQTSTSPTYDFRAFVNYRKTLQTQ